MKIKTLLYAMLRKTNQYENDRAEVTVEIEDGDDMDVVVADAKATCEAMLLTPPASPRRETFTTVKSRACASSPLRGCDGRCYRGCTGKPY